MNNIMELDNTYVAHTYSRFPIAITRASGSYAYDENGKEYIDLGSGIAVNAFGYCDSEWKNAVIAQLDKLSHASNLYYTEPCAALAKELCSRTGMKRVFFGNSGAEANECAVKVARKWAYDKFGDGHGTVITLKNSFHGRTIAMLSATGQDTFHKYFGPFPEGFAYADANDLDSVKAIAEANKCAAVMIEVVQGEGGVRTLDKEFMQGIQKLCRDTDMLFVIDEVQTGNGRTGELFAYMNFDLSPDIVTTAKGLGGGLPLGACMIGERACNALQPGDHGSTFGGNPVACAGALNILSRLNETLLSGVRERGEYIVEQLTACKGVKSVTGLGLMLGIETERSNKEIAAALLQKGVLVLTAKNKVRLLPPLNIEWDALKKAVDILKEEMSV